MNFMKLAIKLKPHVFRFVVQTAPLFKTQTSSINSQPFRTSKRSKRQPGARLLRQLLPRLPQPRTGSLATEATDEGNVIA